MAHEVYRRLVHASGIVVPGLWAVDLLTWLQVRYLLLLCVTVTLVLEGLRLFVGLDWWIYRTLTREYEQNSVAGYALYMFSSSLTGLVFEPQIAVPAMAMLMLADPVAGFLSADELRQVKRGPVLAVMFGLSTAFAIVFVPLGAAVLGGLAAMVADGVKPVVRGYVVDDNLTIPLLAAGGMFVGTEFLPAVGI